MTIYIDTLIFTNIIIDYLLLSLTAKILKINYRYRRLIAGAVVGGISSLIILLPDMLFIFNLLAKLAIAIIIILTAFGKSSPVVSVKRIFVFFLISSCFSGIVLFLMNLIRSDFVVINNGTVYFQLSPLLLIGFTVTAYAMISVIDRIRTDKRDLIHKVSFFYKGNRCSFLSKYDTCCNIREPFSGSEVIIVERKLLDGLAYEDYPYRIIPFNSLGGEGLVRGFVPDELYIDNEKINTRVYIGVCENVFNGEICSIFNYKNICE